MGRHRQLLEGVGYRSGGALPDSPHRTVEVVSLIAVGGVGVENIAEYVRAGAVGVGVGGSLTGRRGEPADLRMVESVARELVSAAGQAADSR